MKRKQYRVPALPALFLFILTASSGSFAQCDTIKADFSSNTPRCSGDSVDFLFTQTAYGGMTYLWDFGSGASPATSMAQNPVGIVYSTPGLKLITLTVTHAGLGCTDVKTGGISIVEMPNPSFTDNGPQCEQSEVNFTYTGTSNSGWIYNWDFGTGSNPAVSSAKNPAGVKYSGNGSKLISLTVTNGACAKNINQNVTILNKPHASFTAVSPSCTNDSISFSNTGTSGVNYSWNFGSGASPATSMAENPNFIFYPTSGSKSIKQIVIQGSCSDTAVQSLNIIETPSAAFTSNAPQCEGSEINISYTGSTGSGWTYSWDFGSGASPSVSTAKNPMGVIYSTPGSKSVALSVTNQSCSDTKNQSLTINPTPNSGFSSSTPACSGDSVNFSNTGTSSVSYSWDFGSGSSPSISASENPAGIVFNSSGIKNIRQVVILGSCSDTAFGTISVVQSPAPNFNHNAPQCEGAEINFTYTGTTGNGWTYFWDFGSSANPSVSTAQNPIGIKYGTAGSKTVSLTVTNQFCSESVLQNITINPTPDAGFSSNTPGCSGDSVNFQNSGTASMTYAWTFGSSASPSTATAENPKGIIYSASGIKTVRQIVFQGSCSDTAFSSIVIRETPSPSFTSNAPQCEGSAVNFTYTGSTGIGWTYSWDFGSGSNPASSSSANPSGITYTGSGAKSISLAVYNQGCVGASVSSIAIDFLPTSSFSSTAPSCSGDSVLFANTGSTGISGLTFQWNFSNGNPGQSASENPGPVTFTPGPAAVNLIISLGNCSDTAEQSILINETPTVAIQSNAPVCANAPVNFFNSGSAGSKWNYIWDFGSGAKPSVSTAEAPSNIRYEAGGMKTVSLSISDANCSNSGSGQIQIFDLPVARAGSDTTICADECAELGGESDSTYNYLWFPSSTLSSSTIANPLACPLASINAYTLTVTSQDGCISSDTITVTMLPSAIADAGVDLELCVGDSVQIGAALIEGQQYKWLPAAGLSGDSLPSPMASPDSSTEYVLTVSYKDCPAITDEVLVKVHRNPVVSAGEDVTIARGSGADLLATGAIMYVWNPVTGLSNGGIANPSASPEESTTYVVEFTDVNSCRSYDTVVVNVIDADVWIPAAFSPNSDGHNDRFFVRTNGATSFELLIFNRSGELIFRSTDANIGWDGTKQGSGEKLPSGAYVYSVRGDLSDGNSFVERGLINLIR